MTSPESTPNPKKIQADICRRNGSPKNGSSKKPESLQAWINEFIFYPFWNLGFSFSSFGSNLVKPNELIVGFSTMTSLVNYGVELIVPSARRAQGKSSLLERNDGVGLSHGFVGIFQDSETLIQLRRCAKK